MTNLFETRWFGTNHGLARLQDTTWTLFNRNNTPALGSDSITALAYDSRKNLWIWTANGVMVYNPEGTEF